MGGASGTNGSAAVGYGKSHSSSSEKNKIVSDSLQNLTGTQTSETLDEYSKGILDAFMSYASQASKKAGAGFDKASAISDSQGLLQQIFNEFNQSLPQIYNAGAQTGTYNSTQMQGLANNAYAEAVTKSQAIIMQTIKDYAGVTNSQQQTLLGALASALDLQTKAKQTVTNDQQLKEHSTGVSTSSGRSSGSSFDLGAAISGQLF